MALILFLFLASLACGYKRGLKEGARAMLLVLAVSLGCSYMLLGEVALALAAYSGGIVFVLCSIGLGLGAMFYSEAADDGK